MSRHRSARPRYARIMLALAALGITVFAVLGGVGLVPTAPSAAEGDREATPAASSSDTTPAADVDAEPQIAVPSTPSLPTSSPTSAPASAAMEALPADSGTGRRVVFSEGEQRVWLVRSNGSVRRTYLVSGSLEDNLDPGRYAVYSRSRWAVGVDDSGVMEFFVRFTQGENAAIGFHSIPTKLDVPLQTRGQLGSPQSHGCIRQAREDAIALWRFAPEGATVVVI